MIWKPTTLLTFDTKTKVWSKKRFESFQEYYALLNSCFKFPGEYNFKNTEYWRPHAIKFEKDKTYTDYNPNSDEYKEFWLLERRKCIQGIIIDGIYIPGDFYWFINFTPIINKLEMREVHPDLWDGHYHLSMYLELAWNEDLDGGGTKARQKGISLFLVARMAKKLWFSKSSMLKIIGYEEEYVRGEWGILEMYKNHLNEHTGWYRQFNPSETLNWEQKYTVKVGAMEKREVTRGNKTKIKGATTKVNYTKAVGGAALEIYATEAGVYRNLIKVKEYVDPNMKQGGVKTGMFIAMGAVGELKDAEDLQKMCFNPKAYSIKPVKDRFSGTDDDIAFFFPDEWNYTYKDEDTGEIVKCYDKDGNSNLELANKYLALEEVKAKNKDEVSYRLWKSQHPKTLQDAFDAREDNIFPAFMLKSRQLELLKDKDIIVKFKEDEKGNVYHEFSDDIPITSIRPDPKKDNRGAVIIREFPIKNPPFGLYVAGVDPIYNIDTETSRSLMAITIWMSTHERDKKIVQPYPVATYVGRFKKASDTYRVCLMLLKFYNARVAIESNVKDFTEWMIRQGESKRCIRRKELTIISEMMPNSTIRDEIGVRMEGEFKKRCLEKAVHYCEEPLSDEFNLETGESKTLYGVQRLWDKRLIKEMLAFKPDLNTDSLISFMLGLIAAESQTNRHIINEVKSGYENLNPKPVRPKMTPSLLSKGGGNLYSKKMVGHFGKTRK